MSLVGVPVGFVRFLTGLSPHRVVGRGSAWARIRWGGDQMVSCLLGAIASVPLHHVAVAVNVCGLVEYISRGVERMRRIVG